ncbi:DUF616 domain-containing protein [Candidatus Dojkabacteria bacterium]|nr:DUF616 domain-containing protein [Candidatus Dojkabacteria bacterium]
MNLPFFKKKIAIYTAIFGDDYDFLKPQPRFPNVDYFCFTDNKSTNSDLFKIIHFVPTSEDPVRSAKLFKVVPHLFLPEYEYTIWIDATVVMKDYSFINLFLDKLQTAEISFVKHPERNCVYEEAKACIELKKDNKEVINAQMLKYTKEGYPKNYGLLAGGIIARKNKSMKIIKFNELWWNEILHNSRRDQLSLVYSLWKLGIIPGVVDVELLQNEYFYNDYLGRKEFRNKKYA